jgi:hypothetical protein
VKSFIFWDVTGCDQLWSTNILEGTALLAAYFILVSCGLFLNPEDGDVMLSQNVSWFSVGYSMLYRRQNSSKHTFILLAKHRVFFYMKADGALYFNNLSWKVKWTHSRLWYRNNSDFQLFSCALFIAFSAKWLCMGMWWTKYHWSSHFSECVRFPPANYHSTIAPYPFITIPWDAQ